MHDWFQPIQRMYLEKARYQPEKHLFREGVWDVSLELRATDIICDVQKTCSLPHSLRRLNHQLKQQTLPLFDEIWLCAYVSSTRKQIVARLPSSQVKVHQCKGRVKLTALLYTGPTNAVHLLLFHLFSISDPACDLGLNCTKKGCLTHDSQTRKRKACAPFRMSAASL